MWKILNVFHYLPKNWKISRISRTEALWVVKKLRWSSMTLNVEFDRLQTKLKVFHASYSCPKLVNVTAHLVSPDASGIYSNCGTFFFQTKAGENFTAYARSKDSLILLLVIKKDIPIKDNQVTEVFQLMTNIKLLLQTSKFDAWRCGLQLASGATHSGPIHLLVDVMLPILTSFVSPNEKKN